MDNLEKEKYLSFEETEQLCRLYMECQLNLLEEAELQYVLGFIDYSSPIIDEVRSLMNISLSCEMAQNEKTDKNKGGRKKGVFKRILFAAASVAIILSIGLPMYKHFKEESELYCLVFANGQEVSHDKAIAIAESELARIDQFVENIENIESEQQQKIESLK